MQAVCMAWEELGQSHLDTQWPLWEDCVRRLTFKGKLSKLVEGSTGQEARALDDRAEDWEALGERGEKDRRPELQKVNMQ